VVKQLLSRGHRARVVVRNVNDDNPQHLQNSHWKNNGGLLEICEGEISKPDSYEKA